MHTQYYYFVAGLPALGIDDSKSQITLAGFMDQAKTQLTAHDFRLLLMLTLPEDVSDLLRIIYKQEGEGRPIDECSRMFWSVYAGQMKQKAVDSSISIGADYRIYPEFWHRIILEAFQAEEMPPFLETQHKMLEAIFAYVDKLPSKFLAQWFGFNRDIRNILTAINGRAHKVEFSRWLVGKGELVEKLSKSHAADFGLGKGHELLESLTRIWEQNNILYRERGYDILRWKWIDNFNFFNYFNIDRILGYYAQLRILERWLQLDPTYGKEVFHDTMDSLSNSFSFPEQFNVKSISKK
jgi:hypothetical protein